MLSFFNLVAFVFEYEQVQSFSYRKLSYWIKNTYLSQIIFINFVIIEQLNCPIIGYKKEKLFLLSTIKDIHTLK
jgi:hypothetical protein